jgi:type VI secretion system protein ImpJ
LRNRVGVVLAENIFKLENSIQWHEGLLIYPQHFQQMRAEFRHISLFYLSMATPFYWGLRMMEIDTGALAGGVLSIKEVLALMPDGSVVFKDASSENSLELDLKPYKDQMDGKELRVHLAVIKSQENSKNVGGEYGRYESVEGKPVVDENTGENPITFPRLSLKAFLIVGDDVPVRYSALPLLGVTFKDDIYARTDLIAPYTNMHKVGPLFEMVHPLIESLRSRLTFLSERLQSTYNNDTASMMDRYEKIYTLICGRLLALEALFYTEGSHPILIHKELCGTAGAFSSLVPGQIPPIFSPYNHNDLRATFVPILEYIDKMLSTVKNPCVSTSFVKKGRMFSHNVLKEWMGRGYLVLGIKLGTDLTPKDAAEWIEGAVITSDSQVNVVKEKRVLGAVRQVVDQVAELGLMMTRERILIKVDIDPLFILENEPLNLFNLSDTDENRPSEIVLYTTV